MTTREALRGRGGSLVEGWDSSRWVARGGEAAAASQQSRVCSQPATLGLARTLGSEIREMHHVIDAARPRRPPGCLSVVLRQLLPNRFPGSLTPQQLLALAEAKHNEQLRLFLPSSATSEHRRSCVREGAEVARQVGRMVRQASLVVAWCAPVQLRICVHLRALAQHTAEARIMPCTCAFECNVSAILRESASSNSKWSPP